MKTLVLSLVILANVSRSVHAQGTLVYDQQSSTDEAYQLGGPAIQFYPSLEQSFTPSLSSVGFVRLKLNDIAPGNSLGATLLVNLRSNSMSGPILGTTTPVVLGDSFAGSVNFIFATDIPVVPNTAYFFQTIVQSGDNWGISVLTDTYLGGSMFAGGFPVSGNDLWFREGIVVPEPSAAMLLFMASGVADWFLRQKRRGDDE